MGERTPTARAARPPDQPADLMLNILIVYHYKSEYPVRAATTDHLYCFQKYARHNCYYLNVAVKGMPRRWEGVRFDIIIFHTLFFSARWSRPLPPLPAVRRNGAPCSRACRVRSRSALPPHA